MARPGNRHCANCIGALSFPMYFSNKIVRQETKMCRYNWHSAGSMDWPFPILKCKSIFQINYTEAILSNSTRKLLWFEITKMLIAVLKTNILVIYYNFRHALVALLAADCICNDHSHELTWPVCRK